MRLAALLIAALMAWSAQAAVQPDEILDDPALEARARALSAEIRCLVCRSESINESNADLARDLRILIRERITAGDSDTEVKDFLVERYGEYVLLKPPFSWSNAALWLAGPALFLIGGLVAWRVMARRPEAAAPDAPLGAEEKARLDALLGDRDR